MEPRAISEGLLLPTFDNYFRFFCRTLWMNELRRAARGVKAYNGDGSRPTCVSLLTSCFAKVPCDVSAPVCLTCSQPSHHDYHLRLARWCRHSPQPMHRMWLADAAHFAKLVDRLALRRIPIDSILVEGTATLAWL
jgi:hypothetical protein